MDQKSGLLETLVGISADRAFTPIALGKTSIAAQVNHITHYLLMMESFMLGQPKEPDWQKTWQLAEATPEGWAALKTELETVYRRLLERLRQVSRWGKDDIGEGMAALVHSAYHLGAIRQIMQVVREG